MLGTYKEAHCCMVIVQFMTGLMNVGPWASNVIGAVTNMFMNFLSEAVNL